MPGVGRFPGRTIILHAISRTWKRSGESFGVSGRCRRREVDASAATKTVLVITVIASFVVAIVVLQRPHDTHS